MSVEIPLIVICLVVTIASGWISYLWKSQANLLSKKMDKETCDIKHKALEKYFESVIEHIQVSLEELKDDQKRSLTEVKAEQKILLAEIKGAKKDLWRSIDDLRELVHSIANGKLRKEQ